MTREGAKLGVALKSGWSAREKARVESDGRHSTPRLPSVKDGDVELNTVSRPTTQWSVTRAPGSSLRPSTFNRIAKSAAAARVAGDGAAGRMRSRTELAHQACAVTIMVSDDGLKARTSGSRSIAAGSRSRRSAAIQLALARD